MNELIENVGHIGEILRTLQAFVTSGTSSLSEKEIVAIANRTAGQIGRYPRPRPALRFSKQIGLVRQQKHGYCLSPLGIQYIKNGKGTDATTYQNRLLLGLLLDSASMRAYFSDFFAKAHGAPQIQVPQGSLTTLSLRNTARLLQQVGCIEYRDENFFLVAEFEDVVGSLIRSRAALTEKDLWERLEAQRLRAVFVEECVIRSEQDRLKAAAREDLADTVTRISALDTGAGYDIASFDIDGTPRYVEVKSSVGKKIEFEWSAGELEAAEKLGRDYWIYFVPFSHLIQGDIDCLVRIRDPIRKLRRHQLSSRPSGWHVYPNEETALRIKPKVDGRQTFDW